MNDERRPTLHVIAGPNGAGKTTLYRNRLEKRYPEAEFVNADELAWKTFGHPARTAAESAKGQELAESRRRELMASKKSLVTESTFSHPSKVDLVREAKAAGYEVVLYHVNVRSPNLSVYRVANRVEQGGHPVPEDKIRQRYERNQPLIREAAKLADRAYIFDNSELGKAHKLTAVLENGKAVRVDREVPGWARELYKEEFKNFSPARLHPAAASFDEARDLVRQQLGDGARTYIPRPNGKYTGPVIAETALHVVQKIGKQSAVAHFRSKLDQDLKMGTTVEVSYDKRDAAKVRTERDMDEARKRADALRTSSPRDAIKAYPELAGAYAYLRAVEARVGAERPSEAARVVEQAKRDLAGRIEQGESIPQVERRDRDHGQDKGR